MSFDALAMHAVRDELEANILGGFVEKVVPLSSVEVGLRIRSHHRDFNLLMSADSQSARIHLVHGTLRRLSDEVTPFLLLLRKYVRESRIVSIEQPTLERVIKLAVEKRHEDGVTTAATLIIEAMGRHSNVILVGSDGEVLDAIKRIPPSVSRQRPILPHLPYSPPPAVDKLSPLLPDIGRQLAGAAVRVSPASLLWRFVQETTGGIGPLSAREVAYRACGDTAATIEQCSATGADPWGAVAEALASLAHPLATHEWSPCVVVQDGDVIHFAPYPLTQFPDPRVESVSSISEAIERAFAERLNFRPAESLRAPLRATLNARIERARRKEDSLRQALSRGEKAEALKGYGQAVLASIGQIGPGQTEIEWDGATIALDPRLSPAENAQRYFKEYTKARDATREIPTLLDSARLESEYLEQMLTHVELAEGEVELRTLSREIAEAAAPRDGSGGVAAPAKGRAGGKQKPGKQKASQPAGTVRRFTSGDGHQMLVGGSARGNERATFDLGTGGDLWLHARQIPGAHVIVKLAGQEPSRRTLLEAARLAASNSQARGSTRVPVDYTLQRYVKKVKGGPPGLVTYTNEKTVRVDATEAGTTNH